MSASNQANVKFSHKKYYSFRKRISPTFGGRFHADMCIDFVARALCYGDVYFRHEEFPADILVGENFSRNYNDFLPVVQLFLGKNDKKIKAKTELFGEDVWKRIEACAALYTQKHPDLFRDGLYYFKK